MRSSPPHPRRSNKSRRTVSIIGTGSYVPERVLTNRELKIWCALHFRGRRATAITKVLHVGPRASRIAMRSHNHKILFSLSLLEPLNLLDLHRLETPAKWAGKAAVLVSLCGQVAHATPPVTFRASFPPRALTAARLGEGHMWKGFWLKAYGSLCPPRIYRRPLLSSILRVLRVF
jgi:hypothetical protein